MAYQKDKTGVRQTAVNAAATITAALVNVGLAGDDIDAVKATLVSLRDELFTDLATFVDEDNQMFRDNEASSPAPKKSWNKPSGGAPSGGGNVTFEQARDLELNFGMFKGCTIGEVWAMSNDEAGKKGYVDKQGNDRSAKEYVKWLTTNDRNPFVQVRAVKFIEGTKATSEAA